MNKPMDTEELVAAAKKSPTGGAVVCRLFAGH